MRIRAVTYEEDAEKGLGGRIFPEDLSIARRRPTRTWSCPWCEPPFVVMLHEGFGLIVTGGVQARRRSGAPCWRTCWRWATAAAKEAIAAARAWRKAGGMFAAKNVCHDPEGL